MVTEEFLVRGYDATSMEDLSRATGMAKSALYHHVSGKEELLRSEEELRMVHILHRVLADMNPVEAMELLLKQLGKQKTNAEFLNSVTLT